MSTRMNRSAAKFVAATVVATAGLAAASGSAHAASWQYQDLDYDGDAEVALWDGDRNGYAEVVWLDYDNDRRWDIQFLNTWGGDSYLEWITVDLDENGLPEVAFYDYDHRVGYEWMYVDANRDGRWDPPGAISTTQMTIGGNAILAQSVGLDTTGLLALLPGLAYGCGGYLDNRPCM